MVDDFINNSMYIIDSTPLKAGFRLTFDKILYFIKIAIIKMVYIHYFKQDLTRILNRFIFSLWYDTTNY
jgi:hypothetical protein